MNAEKVNLYKFLVRKIAYSKIMPRFLLRIVDDLLLIPAMWFPGSFFRVLFNRLRGVKIGDRVWVGVGVILGNHPFLVRIGNDVIISPGAKILTHDTSFTVVGGKDLAGEVVIGNNVQIGENAIILPGITIGNRSIIGAGAVVNRDITQGQIAVGVPAKIISSTEEGLKRLEEKLKTGRYFSTW